MLKEIKILSKLNICNLYGINVFKNTKDSSKRAKSLGLFAAVILVVAVAWMYVGMLVYGYVTLGIGEIIPAYLVMISSLIMLFLGIFKAGHVVFEKKGYDILCSLPVSKQAIIISRFVRMYVENLIFALMVMIPGVAVYGFLLRPSLWFYIGGFIATVLIPLAPMTVSIVIGSLITAITSRMKYKSLVGTGLSVLLTVGIMFLSSKLAVVSEDVTTDMLYDFVATLTEIISKIYPPAVWFGDFVLAKDFCSALLFSLCMLVVLVATAYIIGKSFQTIYQNLYASAAKSDFEMDAQKQKSVLSALCKREFKRYFASSVYVTNTIIGPIMASLMSGALFFVGTDAIVETIGMLPIDIDLIGVVPLIIGGVFCMMTTTATSISMEGKEWWIAKSLPLSAKDILDAKLLMNLLLIAPFYVVSELFLVLALKPSALELIWVVGMPAALIILSCIWGITANLKLAVFDWENEVSVVKQSMSALVGGMAGMIVAVIFVFMMLVVPITYSWIFKLVICMVLIAVTGVLYNKNNKVKLTEI